MLWMGASNSAAVIECLGCGRLPHFKSQYGRHCPSQVKRVDPDLSAELNSSTRTVGLQFLNWILASIQIQSLDYNNPGVVCMS